MGELCWGGSCQARNPPGRCPSLPSEPRQLPGHPSGTLPPPPPPGPCQRRGRAAAERGAGVGSAPPRGSSAATPTTPRSLRWPPSKSNRRTPWQRGAGSPRHPETCPSVTTLASALHQARSGRASECKWRWWWWLGSQSGSALPEQRAPEARPPPPGSACSAPSPPSLPPSRCPGPPVPRAPHPTPSPPQLRRARPPPPGRPLAPPPRARPRRAPAHAHAAPGSPRRCHGGAEPLPWAQGQSRALGPGGPWQ